MFILLVFFLEMGCGHTWVWSYLGRHTGFPTGVENMRGGGLFKFNERLDSIQGGSMGGA